MARLPRSVGDVAALWTRPVRTAPAGGVGVGVAAGARSAPVLVDGALFRQHDPTTCGSTALLLLAAAGDPVLARWLQDGTLPPGLRIDEVPPEIPLRELAVSHSAADRIRLAQQHVKRRTDAHAIGSLPWPGRLGTPPWTAVREARFPGVRYVQRAVDDRGASGRVLVNQVTNAVHRGFPVLLFTGGSLAHGLPTAVPRHVVLALPPTALPWIGPTDRPELLRIFEPSFGRVHEIPPTDLADRTTPALALGGWTHVQWLGLPIPSPS